jgi:hypothetical protein
LPPSVEGLSAYFLPERTGSEKRYALYKFKLSFYT